MKKLLLFLIPIVFASIVFFGYFFFTSRDTAAKGALQVTSIPKSKVYLNDKLLGETPLCKCEFPDMLTVGSYTLRLVPGTQAVEPFEEKITIGKSVLTVVDRTFNGSTASEGSTISLNPITDAKSAQISVVSIPDKSDVLIDKNPSGQTPLLINNTTISDHEVAIKRSGYKEKTIHIHTVAGYILQIVVSLAVDPAQIDPTQITQTATPSGAIQPSVSPTVAPSSPVSPSANQVLILDTPTGFLRVRDSASLGGNEIARVSPGDTFSMLDQQSGWIEIKLSNGKTGWVSSQYVKRQ